MTEARTASSYPGVDGHPGHLPTIVEHVLNVPYANNRYRRLVLGGYTTQNGEGQPEEHALVHTKGIETLQPGAIVTVRLNSACFTGDVFHDRLCDCNWQLVRAFKLINQSTEPGLVLYHINHEGKANGWVRKLKAYRERMFAVDTDKRDFRAAVAILLHLGITRVRLLTNNPEKQDILTRFGIEVVEAIRLISTSKDHGDLLKFKREKLGHMIPECVGAS